MASDEREYSTTEGVPAVASFQNDSTETTVVPVDENDTPDGRNSPVMGVWKPPVTPEHPEGAEIRRQVEWYFSDQNLPLDEHLWTLCGGYKNLPVSIGEILGWKRMRRFRPKLQVIEALKKSAFLEIVDGKRIRRRMALVEDNDTTPITGKLKKTEPTGKEHKGQTQSSIRSTEDGKYGVRSGVITSLVHKKPPKATGFEEFYAEGPVTPAEFEEEEDLYSEEVTISERLEICIQRYRLRRKFTPEASRFFDDWLKFGGIEVGPRQFGPKLNKQELKELHPADRARAVATHHVDDEKEDPTKWTLDFLGVAEAYLSSYFPESNFDYSDAEINLQLKVMTNFYNYLLLHNVIPEANESILAARRLAADRALKELSAVKVVNLLLPGPFNRSCSYLFGGSEAIWSQPGWGPQEIDEDEKIHGAEGARVTVVTGVAAMGSDTMFDLVSSGADVKAVDEATKKLKHAWTEQVKVVQKLTADLEVVSIAMPTKEATEIYVKSHTPKLAMKPLGILTCKPWFDDNDVIQYDVPEGYNPLQVGLPDQIKFWIEMPILRAMFVGMKLTVDMRKLDFGGSELWTMDSVGRVYCSFYKFLLNEMMPKPWKKVKMYSIGKDPNEDDPVPELEKTVEEKYEPEPEQERISRDEMVALRVQD